MIHTDGTPTIANAPRPAAPFEVVGELLVDLDEPLLEREVGGIAVTLHYFANRPVLRVRDAQGEHQVIVPREKALDAFRHPYLYIAR